jgi:tetratricopeptide (TPR) repeat protein
MANNASFFAPDIPQFLGLAHAAYGNYRKSVEAFSNAFIAGQTPSDNLLLQIARSYIAMEEFNMAISYLQHCINTSVDSNSIMLSRFMLAEIYRNINDFENAELQYISILEETGESAEVHFQLGELYNLKGDTTRARAQWRIAFRQDPLHVRARARLNI